VLRIIIERIIVIGPIIIVVIRELLSSSNDISQKVQTNSEFITGCSELLIDLSQSQPSKIRKF
jgi:hypothetical protein